MDLILFFFCYLVECFELDWKIMLLFVVFVNLYLLVGIGNFRFCGDGNIGSY